MPILSYGNDDSDKNLYRGYNIGFEVCFIFSLSNGKWGKYVVIFRVGSSSSLHVIIRTKDTLLLGEDPTDELDDATITAEIKYSINITKSRKKSCLSLHYKASNSFLYTNGVKIYQFKGKKLK